MKVLDSARFGFVFAAILLISNVQAACQGDIVVVTQQDMDQMRNCKTYGGNILVDNSGVPELKMNGVELLEGDLIISNNNGLQKLAFPKLQGINGQLKLVNNKLLSTIDMKQLYAIRSLEVSVHPALNDLKFPAGLSQAEKIIIADTTITKVEGFKMTSVKDVEISNNIYLKSLSFGNMTNLGNILVSANSPSLRLDLSQIDGVREATFRNVAQISLDNLKKVLGDISFISNSFESLEMPAATDISGTLTLTDNINLSNLSMPQLAHLGGALSVGGNTKLTNVNAFPNLQQVDGTLDITGGFDEVQFPALSDVRGGLNVQTSSNFFSCDSMNKLKNGVIKGNSFICKAAVAKPKSNIKGKGGAGGSDFIENAGNTLSYGYLTIVGATLAYLINAV
ncbi:uncharacterized protein ATC70_007889 [Mucor velutinosus]|uniref:Meiotic expression up-regulated protein 10 n=1 Tax=Mucor velutinosus TaxID=708070 RepID=A0AAN7D2Q9_9FUNG|nr:hypothetical protein ATC70_007889 [Mucor velutinosus]